MGPTDVTLKGSSKTMTDALLHHQLWEYVMKLVGISDTVLLKRKIKEKKITVIIIIHHLIN